MGLFVQIIKVEMIFSAQRHFCLIQPSSCCVFQTVEEFGGVDILVSNAAVNPVFGPILEVSINFYF